MSDGSLVTDCCGACFGICCLGCCQSILISLNFRKPGERTVSTQRGCCKNLGESAEDDEFEENARRGRVTRSPKNKGEEPGKGQSQNSSEGNENEEEVAKENEREPEETVSEQPGASAEMTANTTDAATMT